MKGIFTKLIILIIVFLGTLGCYYYVNIDREEKTNTIMGEARLPIISADIEGIESNLMYGYTSQMEAAYMRDALTIIPKNHALNLNIYRYNAGILSIGFEVRSIDSKRLIEDTQIEEWTPNEDKISAVLNINNMIEKDTEYLMIIKLSTEDFGEVYYYTRIIDASESYYKKEAEFVHEFNDSIFDEEKSESIISYIEPDGEQDNSNFGTANIHSSFNHITWGDLQPERVTEPVISCKEIIGDVGNFELKYMIKAKNDYDDYQYYNVIEDYRVKWTKQTMYLLDYKRTLNQEFDANNQNISGSRINTGIDEDLAIDMVTSENKSYIAFIKERTLWLMDTEKNQIIRVFSFKDENDTDLRNINDAYEIEIVSVDDNSNIEFLVYGYMNRGKHEGKVGVALYRYYVEENVCKETLFIPFTRSYEILKESIGKLSYVNENNMCIMINDCIYSIDLKGNEYVQLISNLKDGTYVINDEGNMIAWQVNGGERGGTKIKLLNLKDGKEFEQSVGGKYRMKVLGFVNDDLVYGIASASRIKEDKNGHITFLMSKIKVVSSENEVLKEYSKKGIYFPDVEIKDNMVNITQVTYAEDGTLQQINDYQIFGNIEEEQNDVKVTTIATDLKKTEVVINFVYKVTSTSKLKNIYPNEVVFDETNAMSIRELSVSEGLYYVHSYGKVEGVYTKESEAIIKADKHSGVVIDENGDYLWKRISRPTESNISGISVKATESETDYVENCLEAMLAYNGVNRDVKKMLANGKSSVNIINSLLDGRGLDLSGCSLPQILYYICSGQPVMGMIDDTRCVIVVGYDFYNAIMINPGTGEAYKMGIEETEEMFKKSGNRFVGIRD